MKFSGLAAAAGLAASVQGYGYADTGCVDGIHFVVAAGDYTTQGNLSLLQSTMDLFMSQNPNSNLYQLPYEPNATPQTNLATMIPALTDHLTSYIASCPNTKIATVGYSIGGAIVMDVLCGGSQTGTDPDPLNPDWRHNFIANIIYGDPTYVSRQRSAQGAGTCTSPTGQGKVPRVYPGKCYPFGRKTRTYCDADDMVCCNTSLTDPNPHFLYPQLYNDDAAAWIKAKWNYYVHHKNGNSKRLN